MDYVRLGQTGLEVSRICLGCMSYGEPDRGNHPWTLDEEPSRPFIRQALDAGHQLLRHRQRLLRRHQRGDRRPGAARLRQPRRGRASPPRCTAGCGPGPNGARPVAQGDPDRDRRQPAPARHRLRRPLPDPPLGPRHADRGDAGGAARRGARPARRATSARRRCTPGSSPRRCTSPTLHGWTRFVSHAEPLQPALPRGGARDAAALRRPGHRRHPVEPAGPRPADPRLGRADRPRRRPTSSAGRSTTRRATGRSSSAVAEVAERARRAARPGRAGLAAARKPGGHRADRRRRPSRSTSTTPSPPSTWSCTDEEIARLEEPYRPAPTSPGSERGQSPGGAGGGEYIRPRCEASKRWARAGWWQTSQTHSGRAGVGGACAGPTWAPPNRGLKKFSRRPNRPRGLSPVTSPAGRTSPGSWG